MRKRHHTNQSKYQFSLNGSSSNRALRGYAKGASRSISKKLASEQTQIEKLAKTNQESIDPLSGWSKEEGYEMKLADEISQNELKGFAFSCIESLANLAQSGKQSIDQVLASLVSEKLTSFVNLAQERQQTKREFKEYVAWCKQFISSVQPLLSTPSGPAQEMGQLTTQVMQCAERSMCQKYRSEALGKRVNFLVGAVADYVANTGVEMGFPKPVMVKVSKSVNRALTAVTK